MRLDFVGFRLVALTRLALARLALAGLSLASAGWLASPADADEVPFACTILPGEELAAS